MKKLGLYLCAGVLALSLGACGQKDQEDSSQQTDSQQESSSQETEQQSEESSSQETEQQPEESPSQGAEGDQEDPGMDISNGWSEEMEKLRQAVITAVGQENYWPDMPMDSEMLEMSFKLTSDMYEDYVAESPMISANVDTLVIVRAKEGQAEAVEEALKAYREEKVNDTLQYPMNIGKIQASQVERMGDYVIFVQLGADTSGDESEEASINKCKEANSAALEAIRGIVEAE